MYVSPEPGPNTDLVVKAQGEGDLKISLVLLRNVMSLSASVTSAYPIHVPTSSTGYIRYILKIVARDPFRKYVGTRIGSTYVHIFCPLIYESLKSNVDANMNFA